MDCSYLTNQDFSILFTCTIQNIGIPFDIAALGIIATFTFFALYARLDFDLSLGLSTILAWVLLGMSGGSYMLQILFGLLILGVAARIFMTILSILRQ